MTTPVRKISASAASVSKPAPPVWPANLPSSLSAVSLLGVDYFHLHTDDGDLYLTRFGLPFWESLLPKNRYAPREWFEAKCERLEGSSLVYNVPTRPVAGKVLNLVVKWSRVGEVVPFDTVTVNAKSACMNKLISEQTTTEMMHVVQRRLALCGFEDLNPNPDHLLISFDAEQKLVLDTLGQPELHLSNFELIRRRP